MVSQKRGGLLQSSSSVRIPLYCVECTEWLELCWTGTRIPRQELGTAGSEKTKCTDCVPLTQEKKCVWSYEAWNLLPESVFTVTNVNFFQGQIGWSLIPRLSFELPSLGILLPKSVFTATNIKLFEGKVGWSLIPPHTLTRVVP